MNKRRQFLQLATALLFSVQSFAQGETPEVEWYPPEIEKSRIPDRARVIISGKTAADSKITIDGDSVTLVKPRTQTTPVPEAAPAEMERVLKINCPVYELPDPKSRMLKSLTQSVSLRTLEFSERWLKVSTPKVSGFMPKACFHPVKSQSSPERPETAKNKNTSDQKIESREVRSNDDGFFEIVMDLPPGLAQIPVSVSNAKAQKTFLLSIDVSLNNIRLNSGPTTKLADKKPPAAGKKIRIWGGVGLTQQTYSQFTEGLADISFQTIQAPAVLVRAGYWGEDWGVDFYFRNAPGKIEADQPFQLQTDSYNWQTIEAKGLYQIDRGPSSRLWGQSAQWQLRFGTQIHKIPFLEIDPSNNIQVRTHTLNMATLGTALLLGQEQKWSYEFALGLQYALSTDGDGNDFKISSALPLEAQIGAAYKFAPNWRLGLFSYIQSHSYSYEFTNSSGSQKTGSQNLGYTTFDLRIGYEF